jgi:hypothetical protein
VHGAEVVAHRLGRKRALLDGDVALDVARGDAGEFLAGEERNDVITQVGRYGQAVRLLPTPRRQPRRQRLTGLEHRHPLDAMGNGQVLGA